jgi:hypothetical protein
MQHLDLNKLQVFERSIYIKASESMKNEVGELFKTLHKEEYSRFITRITEYRRL